MVSRFKEHFAFISVLLFYLILFLPTIGNVHLFDWDEINFAEAAREMIVSGDWLNVQINFDPFWEKPPFFIWLQAISMSVFGVNEFAARFPNVLVGMVTLIVLYFPVLKRYGKQAAVFTLLFYIGSLTPHFYFKSGIIDPLFNLFIYLGVLYLVKSKEEPKGWYFFVTGLFLGFAVITKGPVALLLVGLTGLIFQVYYQQHFYNLKKILYLVGGLLLVLLLVFGLQAYNNGIWFLKEFLIYQIDLFRYPIASHGQPFYYHFLVLLIGCFPLFIVAFSSMIGVMRVEGDVTFLRWMKILFWVVLVLFSMVTTKIVHYSSMCYIPLAIIGGVWLAKGNKIGLGSKILLATIGLLWIVVFIAFGLLSIMNVQLLDLVKEYIQDDFLLNQLNTSVDWSILPIFLAGVFCLALVRYLITSNKTNMSSLLVLNSLVLTLLLSSVAPPLEKTIQGLWINQLKTYQGKEMAHFTLGFKSYAHRFYTQQKDVEDINSVKSVVMKKLGIEAITDLNQHDKKVFDNALRDEIILSTTIPVSLSSKVENRWLVEKKYPSLCLVFAGNGYDVWERGLVKVK